MKRNNPRNLTEELANLRACWADFIDTVQRAMTKAATAALRWCSRLHPQYLAIFWIVLLMLIGFATVKIIYAFF